MVITADSRVEALLYPAAGWPGKPHHSHQGYFLNSSNSSGKKKRYLQVKNVETQDNSQQSAL